VARQRVLFERSRQRGRFSAWVPRLSPDGRYLFLLSGRPAEWTVYDLATGAERLAGKLLDLGTPPLSGGLLSFAGSMMMLAEAEPAGKTRHAVFRWWDLETGKLVATHEVDEFSVPLAFFRFQVAPGAPRVAIQTLLPFIAARNTVFDVSPAGLQKILEVPTNTVAFSRDGRKLATVAGPEVAVWNLDERGPPLLLSGLEGGPSLLAFSPDGRRLVAGEAGQRLRVWDLTTGRELLALPCPFPAQALRFVGDRLVVVSGDNRLWVLDGTPPDRR
jgi:WD40 repeat protein